MTAADDMNPTRQLRDLGQSLWLDNITRALLTSGTLRRCIGEVAGTGKKAVEGRSAEAYMRGIERRIDAGRDPSVACAASDCNGPMEGCE